MEAVKLAEAAFMGLQLLWGLMGVGVAATRADQAPCYQELARDGVGSAVCPRDFTEFSLPDPDAHWMVRR